MGENRDVVQTVEAFGMLKLIRWFDEQVIYKYVQINCFVKVSLLGVRHSEVSVRRVGQNVGKEFISEDSVDIPVGNVGHSLNLQK